MSLDLDAIKARCEAATPGPWIRRTVGEPWAGGEVPGYWYVWQAARHDGSGLVAEMDPDGDQDIASVNAEFIASARTDVPALVAEVERLRGMVEVDRGVGAWA